MVEPSGDRDFLRSIFLMEASEALVVVEDGVARLVAGGEPSWDDLFLVTHRLRGAAAMQGFTSVATLAERLEQTLRPLRRSPAEVRAQATPSAQALVTSLKATLTAIEGGVEPALPIVAASSEPTPAPPSLVAPSRPAVVDPLRVELASFFAANDDVLSYFGPEAAEHLEAMTAAILALERGGAAEASQAKLFRAAHTLKGAAYIVGCRPVGELAHRLEDLLAAVREGRAALTPAVFDTSLAVVECLKHMLDPAANAVLDLTSEAAGLRARIATLLESVPVVAPDTLSAPPLPVATPLVPTPLAATERPG